MGMKTMQIIMTKINSVTAMAMEMAMVMVDKIETRMVHYKNQVMLMEMTKVKDLEEAIPILEILKKMVIAITNKPEVKLLYAMSTSTIIMIIIIIIIIVKIKTM